MIIGQPGINQSAQWYCPVIFWRRWQQRRRKLAQRKPQPASRAFSWQHMSLSANPNQSIIVNIQYCPFLNVHSMLIGIPDFYHFIHSAIPRVLCSVLHSHSTCRSASYLLCFCILSFLFPFLGTSFLHSFCHFCIHFISCWNTPTSF